MYPAVPREDGLPCPTTSCSSGRRTTLPYHLLLVHDGLPCLPPAPGPRQVTLPYHLLLVQGVVPGLVTIPFLGAWQVYHGIPGKTYPALGAPPLAGVMSSARPVSTVQDDDALGSDGLSSLGKVVPGNDSAQGGHGSSEVEEELQRGVKDGKTD